MFDPVDPRQSFPALEHGILRYWREQGTFKRSLEQRAGGENFSFYDGPPFATGLPHYGHLLAGTIKDVIPRYQTMRGKYVERRFGWDCHGLPIENLIEKEHGIESKQDIEAMGVANFNKLCRGSVQRYVKEWRHVVERMGRWVDMDFDYKTMDPPYMESIWWAIRQLWDKQLIVEGHKPMHVCPRCVTPLSNFEVTQGYKDVTDQSATAMFALKDEPGTFLLAWTTTPWTLPGNLFLAVHPEVSYARIKTEKGTFLVAENLVEKVFKGMEHVPAGAAVHGKHLVGKSYTPLFPYFADRYENTFRVVAGDFVTTEDGTGIVHIAPGFGEDDYNVGKAEGIDPPLQHVTMDGKFTPEVTDFAGMEVKPKDAPTKTDQAIIAHLKKAGSLFSQQSYAHSYPHCWRCDSPLLNYATSSWFVRVEKVKEQVLAANAESEWVPGHLRDGRFGKWLEGARDWAISRNRYWGTPLPIWRCAETGETEVIGGRADLMAHQAIRFTRVTVLRHSESEGNIKGVYQGECPGSDLTPNGKKLAEATAEWLHEQAPTVIYSSPLARALQTAEILAQKTGAKVIVDERLREVGFGPFEGKPLAHRTDAERAASNLRMIEQATPRTYHHQDGMETWDSIQKRIDGFFAEILPRHRSEHVAVVTHGDPIFNVRQFFTGEDPLKLIRQPMAAFATPETYFWDHDHASSLDLHKEFVDGIEWPGSPHETSVSLTLVRHGETDWNKQGKMLGAEVDEPLNDAGRSQAAECAKALKKKSFDVIVCSDLRRARETADIIAKELDMPVTEWTELRERKLGAWSGTKLTELRARYPYDGQPTAAFHFATPEGGESLSQFLARMRAVCERLRSEYPGKRVLVVAHRGIIQGVRTIAENIGYRDGLAAATGNGEAVETTLHPPLRRTPEVLDCWFESGSMPYAQPHYPFEPGSVARHGPKTMPTGFPADFIAEGIDQTRGWFYTLTVLAASLFQKPAFLHCIVNGTVLAEDGKKMSKRLKNYPDPLEITEKYGADAIRFALMSSPAVRAEDLRFSEKLVEETMRAVLLPMWNAYGFFVLHANAAGFSQSAERSHSAHPLDRWIRAEVQDLVNRMTAQLDAYDLSATCAELHETIDALTNWYIRLSRRRFAGKGTLHLKQAGPADTDQQAALGTLHDVLLTLSQLLAPFCPFLTEAIYLNLSKDEHGSVHLTDWPATQPLNDEQKTLLTKNRLLRQIASLGHTARAEKKIRIRQPLAGATVAIPPDLDAETLFTREDKAVLQDEMNVKEIRWADEGMAQAVVMVDAKKVGPRLGKRVQEIIKMGKEGQLVVGPDGHIRLEDAVIAPDEFRLVYREAEGEGMAAGGGVAVKIDARLTLELQLEGDARDLIRAIQRLRKEAGLNAGDAIVLSVEGADELLKTFGSLVEEETNAGLGDATDAPAHEAELEGRTVRIRFRKP